MVKVGDYAMVRNRHGVHVGFVRTVGRVPLLDGHGRFIHPLLVSISLGSRNGKPWGITVPEAEVTVLPDPVKE